MRNLQKLKFFGINVKAERLKCGISQEELAERADISRNMVSLVETGKMNPTILKVIDIADSLGVSVEKLLKDI